MHSCKHQPTTVIVKAKVTNLQACTADNNVVCFILSIEYNTSISNNLMESLEVLDKQKQKSAKSIAQESPLNPHHLCWNRVDKPGYSAL